MTFFIDEYKVEDSVLPRIKNPQISHITLEISIAGLGSIAKSQAIVSGITTNVREGDTIFLEFWDEVGKKLIKTSTFTYRDSYNLTVDLSDLRGNDIQGRAYTVGIDKNLATTVTSAGSLLWLFSSLQVESIYLDSSSDISLLPPGYSLPLGASTGGHGCDRAAFEITLNNVFMGNALMNNAGGSTESGVLTTTSDPVYVEGDYGNTPWPLNNQSEVGWSQGSRYSSITLTEQDAVAATQAANGSSEVVFRFPSMITTYNVPSTPHSDVVWLRISRDDGEGGRTVVFNGVQSLNTTFTIDLLNPPT